MMKTQQKFTKICSIFYANSVRNDILRLYPLDSYESICDIWTKHRFTHYVKKKSSDYTQNCILYEINNVYSIFQGHDDAPDLLSAIIFFFLTFRGIFSPETCNTAREASLYSGTIFI